MFIVEFFNLLVDSVMSWLGLVTKECTIVFVGLDNAGKSTLMQQLKKQSHATVQPTQRAQMDEVVLNNITFRAWDLGGHDSWRSVWADFYEQADAVLFMVDAADTLRIEEAREELELLLEDDELLGAPVLILGNKIDLDNAMDEATLQQMLGLDNLSSKSADRPLRLFRTSVTNGQGYSEAFEWLAEELLKL